MTLYDTAVAAIREAVDETPSDSLRRARLRVGIIIAAAYEDEPSEPDQAIRDLLTDIVHECNVRGVDVDSALDRAKWMVNEERKDWGIARVE